MRTHISIFMFLFAAVGLAGGVTASTFVNGGYYFVEKEYKGREKSRMSINGEGTSYTAQNVAEGVIVTFKASPDKGMKIVDWGTCVGAGGGSVIQKYDSVNWTGRTLDWYDWQCKASDNGYGYLAVRFDYIPLEVTFNGNGGTGSMDPITGLNIISNFTLTANSFTKTGYHFIGWKTNQTSDVIFKDKAQVKGSDLWNGKSFNSTFYAQWEADGTILLDNHGADLEKGTASVTVAPGNPLPKISVPRKTGNDFNGYFEKEDGEGEQYWYKNGMGLVDDWQGLGVTTAHAAWVAHEYKLSYANLEDASVYPKSAKYGEEIMLAEPVRRGLTFAGWNIVAGLKSLHAEWHQAEKGWSTISTTYQRLQADGVNPTKTIWLRNLNTNDQGTVTINANWTTNSYKINLKFEGAINTPTKEIPVKYGAIPGGVDTVPDYGSGMIFTGYVDFQGRLWYGADGKLTAEFADYHWDRIEDLELTAQKGGIEYYITYDANAAHGGSGAEPKQTCNTANEVTLSDGSNMSNPYYSLVGWSKNPDTLPRDVIGTNFVPGGHPSYSELGVTKDGTDITLYAIWRDRRVTIGIDAAGGKAFTNDVEVTELVYVDGEKYGFLPTAERPKYKFDGWYSAATGGTLIEPDMIVSKADVPVLYAHWSPEKFYVRFDGNGASNETEMAVQEFVFNEEKRLFLNEYGRAGYDYAGWTTNATDKTKVYDDGQMVSNLTETVGATNVLYALWDPHHYTITFRANGGKGEDPADIPGCAYDSEIPLPTPSYTPPKNYATFVGWSTNKNDATGISVATNLTAEAGGIVTLYAVWYYDVGEWSRVLDCNNLMFTNDWAESDRAWQKVYEHGAREGSDAYASQSFSDSTDAALYAVTDESGTLSFCYRLEHEEDYLTLEIPELDIKVDLYVATADTWTESETYHLVKPEGVENFTIKFLHNGQMAADIDCVTWTPDGGGEPTPGDPVEVTAASVEGNVFALTIPTESGTDYGVWTNADLTVDSWGLMGEPQKGEGDPLEFKWTILPEFPQLFFRAHKVEYK